MSYLRVAAFDMPGSYEVWDATLGEYLRSSPGCVAAKASSDGSTWLVVTEWTSREVYEADLASPGLQKAYEAAATQLGLTADLQPTFLYEGEIGATA